MLTAHVPAVVAQKPELKDKEPFKTVLSGDRKAIAKLSIKDLETILVATLTRMPLEEFDAEAKKGSLRPLTRAGNGPIPI
jgi:hypothetical protein